MKVAILVCFSSFFLFVYAQDRKAYFTPDGLFDKVYDRFGNVYQLSDLKVGGTSSSTPKSAAVAPTLLCSSGYFDLYFEAGSGMEGSSPSEIERRNVLCQVFYDLSQFIESPNPNVHVSILVKNINPLLPGYNFVSNPNPATSSTLFGLATSFMTVPSTVVSSGIVDNEIWKTINAGVDSYTSFGLPLYSAGPMTGNSFYHGIVAFNFENSLIKWHTDLSEPTGIDSLDLYSSALHEIGHALGIGSLIGSNGASKLDPYMQYYSRYDMFLKTSANQPLITNTGTCSLYNYGFNPSLNSSILSPSTFSCATQIQFGGSVNQAAYTPSVFQTQSSLSHLEDLCHLPTPYPDNEYYVVSDANGPGPAFMKRFFKPEERNVLCDIGYKVKTTYGNAANLNYYNYGGTVCPGIKVTGVNDGIDQNGYFQHVVELNTPITISNIWQNDPGAYSFECLQVIVGGGSVNVTSGTSFIYTGTTTGVKLLRYIPVSAAGDKGNITYVFIYVNSTCAPTLCDFVKNGGFENSTSCGALQSNTTIDCWIPFSNSPDLFSRGCGGQHGIPTSLSNPASDSWNGVPNNRFLGICSFGIGTGSPNLNESVQTQLDAPLLTNHVYTISFQAKVANNRNALHSIPPGVNGEIVIGGGTGILAPISVPTTALPNGITPLGNPFSIANDNTWHSYTQTFTYTGATSLTSLILINSTNMNTAPNAKDAYIYIDDVSLVEEIPLETLNLPALVCSNQIIPDLSLFAPVSGGAFSGGGVTSNAGVYSFNAALAGTGNHQISYTYSDVNGCPKTIDDVIEVGSIPISVTINPTTSTICAGQQVSLAAGGATTYSWSPLSGLSAGTGASVIASPSTTTTYTVTGTNSIGCVGTATTIVTVQSLSTPTFTFPASYCSGTSIPSLPTTSDNGITGTWSPALNNTVTTTYTFTPAAGQCASQVTRQIVINPNITPTFSQMGPYCRNSMPGTLPVTSNNGINGTWNPLNINTSAAGTTVYTFTPTTGQCAVSTSMSIVVNDPPSISVHNSNPTLCSGQSPTSTTLTAVVTPPTGVSYLWSTSATTSSIVVTPATVGSQNYNVSASLGGCTVSATATVVLQAPTAPTFTFATSYCSGASIPALPTTSNNGITGSWSPALNNTTTTTYTFTPAAGQCANSVTRQIVINPNTITPTFTQMGPYCKNATPGTLPATSTNGISGTWNPSTINTSASGTTVYTFTPTAGQCALSTSMSIVVTAPPSISITNTNPTICAGQSPTSTTLTAVVTPSSGVSYAWSNSATTSSIVVTPTIIGVQGYTVTASVGGCTVTASTDVAYRKPPSISATSSSSTICLGQSTVLSAGGTAGTAYSWSPSSTLSSPTGSPVTAIPTVSGNNVYTLTGTLSGCSSTTSVTINVLPLPSVTGPVGACVGATAVQLVGSPSGGTWSSTAPSIASVSASGLVTPSTTISGTVNIIYTAPGTGCQKAYPFTVYPLPAAPTITGPSTICLGDYGILTSSYATGIVWTPGGATTQSIYVPSPASPTTYTVTYTNSNGCKSSASKTVSRASAVSCTQSSSCLLSANFTSSLSNCTWSFVNSSTYNSATILSPGTGYTFNWVIYNAATGVMVTTGTGFNFSYSYFPSNGIYTVCLTVTKNGVTPVCTDQICKDITVNCANGIIISDGGQSGLVSEELLSPELSVNPNPTIGQTQVVLDHVEKKTVEIKVYDMLGAEMMTLFTRQCCNDSVVKLEWNSQDVPPGIYIIKAFVDSKVLMEKVVVSHR